MALIKFREFFPIPRAPGFLRLVSICSFIAFTPSFEVCGACGVEPGVKAVVVSATPLAALAVTIITTLR